jgi:predicted lipoprotein with Yx(FWY)xxD motif
MNNKRMQWVGILILVLSLALAACQPASNEPASPAVQETSAAIPETGAETSAPAATEAAATEAVPAASSEVRLEVASSPELGSFLVDSEGMTLYLFTKDEPGKSNCSGDCLVKWPPLLASSPDAVIAGSGVDDSKVGTIPFEGGQYLVTYDGMPLYYWINDQQPGDTTGQDVGGVWFVVTPDSSQSSAGAQSTQSSSMSDDSGKVEDEVELEVEDEGPLGPYLKDGNGMTLYLFTKDEPGKSNCSGDCLVKWPPLLVSSREAIKIKEGVDAAKVDVIPFEGGKFLVTYDGMPLYYWVNDKQPGDTTGHEVGGVWFVVKP